MTSTKVPAVALILVNVIGAYTVTKFEALLLISKAWVDAVVPVPDMVTVGIPDVWVLAPKS